ncbi:MATE family efflux transporter [Algirhabdus cladophorae]|uniref:MATE family efflux transporter n=1 Tax=Algirhabdus cladophorae TaxID=3377108 RepID=UPI003B84B50C
MAVTQTYSAHTKALLVLGLPLVGSHLAQMSMTVTDTLMLGRYSVEALAAITLAGGMYFMIFIVGSGFSLAVMPLVAQAAEKGDEVAIRRVTRMGLWLSFGYGLLVYIPSFWSETVLLSMGQLPQVAKDAQTYLRIASLGLIPAMLVMVLKSYLAALERTQIVLWATVVAAIVNAGLNYVLIFGNFGAPELGIKGAAIASLILQIFSLATLVIYVRIVLPQHDLFARLWRPDWQAMFQVFTLGYPIGLTLLAETALFSGAAIMIGWIGTPELAAHGIALQWASVTFMVHLGLSQAATVRAGRALERDDPFGLRRGAGTVIVLSFIYAVITVAVFLIWPEPLISLFLDSQDPERPLIIPIAVGLLVMAALFQVVDGAQVVALGLLRGVQDTKVPMIFAAISYWGIGMPASLFFGFVLDLGAIGVWLGLVVGLGVAAVLLNWRFWTFGISKGSAL